MAGLAGSTHRVTELIERLTLIKHNHDDHGSSDASDDSLTRVSVDSEESKSGLLVDDKIIDIKSDAEEVFYDLSKVSLKPPGWEKNLITDLSFTVKVIFSSDWLIVCVAIQLLIG